MYSRELENLINRKFGLESKFKVGEDLQLVRRNFSNELVIIRPEKGSAGRLLRDGTTEEIEEIVKHFDFVDIDPFGYACEIETDGGLNPKPKDNQEKDNELVPD